jgi:hypothetical protein
MLHRTTTACVFALGLVWLSGCSRGPSRIYPPSIDASAAGVKAMEMYDTNKDGKLSGAELDKCPALKAAMAQIDTDGDGTITAAKITARIRAWQESKVGRTQLTCTVLRNGRPLAGADVKFVPEKFLGDSIKPAEGKTDQNGIATISIPTTDRSDPPGVALGFYRVEITKAGENVPAQYNTNTTLGHEVSHDARAAMEGIKFSLKY